MGATVSLGAPFIARWINPDSKACIFSERRFINKLFGAAFTVNRRDYRTICLNSVILLKKEKGLFHMPVSRYTKQSLYKDRKISVLSADVVVRLLFILF